MKAQIRPNRLDISDRFPLASFTILTDGTPRVAEIVVATDAQLFANKEGRNRNNFYTSREHGVLSLPRNEAVYTIPPEILARFTDATQLWFGLATAPADNGDRDWMVDVLPTASDPYISLAGLTDSSLRRVRMFPGRGRQSAFAGGGTEPLMTWAGDAARPGMSETGPGPQRGANGSAGMPANGAQNVPPAADGSQSPVPSANGSNDAAPYDDGFGPLPPRQSAAEAEAPAAPAEGQSFAQGGNGITADELDDQGIDGPVLDEEPAPHSMALEGRPRALSAAEYTGVTRIMPSPAYSNGRRNQTIDRIVIHITDAPQSRWLGSWFTREEANSSSHYMVDQNGDIIQFVREQDTAWHAGDRTGNRRSIGIEHVAIKQGGATYGSRTYPHTPPSDAEYRASAALVAHLCNKYNLTPDRTTIIGHNEINTRTSHSSCPTGAWDWDHYMPMVTQAYAALGTVGGVGAGQSVQLGLLDPILGTSVADAAVAAARNQLIEDGSYTVSNDRRNISAPGIYQLNQAQRAALQVALMAASPLLGVGRLLANSNGHSLAVGIGGGIGAEAGGTIGGGIIFAPGGEIGLYGLAELDIGAIFSGSVTLQVTVLQGGISSFDGISQVATVSGGEGYVGGLTAIFDSQGRFVGVTFEAGVGFGSPLSVYTGVQRSYSTTVAQSLTYIPVQPLSVDDVQISADQQDVSAPQVDEYSQLRSIAIQALLAANPALFAFVISARAAAEIGDVSIGIGPQVNAGLLGGAGLGAGLIFAPGNVMGAYGGAEIDAGFIASIGASVQLTVLKGGISSFSGISRVAAISGGEGITAGAAVIFDAQGDFLGVSLQVGLGASLSPVEIYTGVQRSVATQLGMAMAFSSEGEAIAAGLGAGNERVEIKYRMFIPSPIIAGLPVLGDFGGDGRSFSYSSGSSRGEMSTTVEVTPGGGIARLRGTSRHWEPTTSYDRDDTRAVSGKPSWWKEKNSSSVRPTGSQGLAVTNSNMRIYRGAPGTYRSVFGATSNSSPVTMMASGNNVMVPGSPNIDADVTLFFRRNSSGEVEVKAIGSHDGFPAHEIYVNGQRIHHYDPVAHGNSPTALFPPTDRDVDTPWRTVAQRTSSAQGYSAQAFGDDIPYDPGAGGMSIPKESLQPGDIILTTTANPVSGVIRDFTDQPVSHAMIYVGQGGQVVEAIAGGVQLRPIEQALADATLAVAFRAPNVDEAKGIEISSRAGEYLGQGFNYVGIVQAALFRLAVAACERRGFSTEVCRALVAWNMDGNVVADRFFCSALVLRAYQDAGAQLTVSAPNWASPGDIGELRLRDDALQYVGHLKTPPGALASGQSQAGSLGVGPNPTINWDDVQVVPQPTNQSCWATAGAMLYGWMHNQSISPQSIAEFAGKTVNDYLMASRFQAFADDVGFSYDGGQSYTPEGFFGRLQDVGALLVLKNNPPILHCVIVTGMYKIGNQWMVRVTDPWDRTVGTPGSPGQYAATHTTGSRYIMKYEDFVAEYEGAAGVADLQVLHSDGNHDHLPNLGPAKPTGYAQSADAAAETAPAAPAHNGAQAPSASPPMNGQAPAAPAPNGQAPGMPAAPSAPTLNGQPVADHGFGPDVSITRQQVDKGQRRYDLAQMRGFVQPQTGAMVESDAMRAEPVLLDNWPYIDGTNGRTHAGVAIDWAYKGGAVGQIGITPLDGASPDGWNVAVKADFARGTDTPGNAQVKVRVTSTFTKQGEAEQVAVSEVSLDGNGRSNVQHGVGETGLTNGEARSEQAPQETPAQPAAPQLARA